MIIGIGVDVVDVPRFERTLERTPALRQRLFTEDELVTVDGRARSGASLAARFAAKEAVAKALGAPSGMAWHDCVVVTAGDGRPSLSITGTVKAAGDSLGVSSWHLSMSHDGDITVATVIAEGA